MKKNVYFCTKVTTNFQTPPNLGPPSRSVSPVSKRGPNRPGQPAERPIRSTENVTRRSGGAVRAGKYAARQTGDAARQIGIDRVQPVKYLKMNKNYNYARRKLFLPEYGRHIHEMVDSLSMIEDRRERNRQARAVIAAMGNLFPLLRDTTDFTHKLWDHLFIMSDFQLDVDSPYPRPSRVELTVEPQPVPYMQHRIRFKQYGRYTAEVWRSLARREPSPQMEQETGNMVRFMRAKSFEYNQEIPNSEMIIRDVSQMTDGAITVDEQTINSVRTAYKNPFTPNRMRPQQNRRQNHYQQKGYSGGHKQNYQKNNRLHNSAK